MNARNKLMWLKWSAIAAPVVMIGVFTVANRLSGPQKAQASAASPDSIPMALSGTTPRDVAKVENWIAVHKRNAPSPFEAAPVPEPTLQDISPVTSAALPEEPKAFEGVRLTGVFRANDNAIAVINGKLVREGQEVLPGVTVASIDARARSVTLKLADGRTIELSTGGRNEQTR